MELSYGPICRRTRQKYTDFPLIPFLWRAPSYKGGLDNLNKFKSRWPFSGVCTLFLVWGSKRKSHIITASRRKNCSVG